MLTLKIGGVSLEIDPVGLKDCQTCEHFFQLDSALSAAVLWA
jgi:hypothetical protein